MSVGVARWLSFIACAWALYQWVRTREVLRHEALILVGVSVYFSLGTLNLLLFTQRVWLVVAVGVWGYFLGGWAGRRSARRDRDGDAVGPNRLLTDGRVLEVIGWFGLALLLLLYRAPGLTGANREAESAYLTSLAQLVIPAYLLQVAARRGGIPTSLWVRATVTGLGLLVSGYRSYTLVLWLSLLVFWLIQPRQALQRVKAVLLAGFLALTVGVGFGYWRFLREGNESGQELIHSVFATEDVSALELTAGFAYVAFFREGPSILGLMVERHPALEPYTHGRALWGMITSPLPGEQWDARAIASKEVYGIRETSLVSTIFGPWYLDFGLLGVFGGLALLGVVLSRLEVGALVGRNRLSQAAYSYGLVVMGLSIHTGLTDFAFAILIPAVFLWATRSTTHSTTLPAPEPD
jgi:Putative O-antigen polymerase